MKKNFYASRVARKQLVVLGHHPRFLIPVMLTIENRLFPVWMVIIRKSQRFYMYMDNGNIVAQEPQKAEIIFDGFKKAQNGDLRMMKYLPDGEYLFEITNIK